MIDKIKPFLPVLYIALGVALGGFAVHQCSDPKIVTRVDERIDTVKALPDTVEIEKRIPVFITRPLPEPTPDSTAGFWIELLWKENTMLRQKLDSCRGISLTAVTETDRYMLKQQFIGPVFWSDTTRNLGSAMPHELHIKSSDTTRTEIQPCPTDWWRTVKDYTLAGSLGYIVIEIIRSLVAGK